MKPVAYGCALLLLLSGCALQSGGSASAPSEQVTAHEQQGLVAPEPNATRRDYKAKNATLRLFGVQRNAERGATATIADTSNWATRDYHVGDNVGRGYRLEEVGNDWAELRGPEGVVRLLAGDDTAVRLIAHRFDDALTYRGKLAWAADAAAVADLYAQHGVGASGEAAGLVLGEPAVRLTQVEPEGVFGRLGLHAGDLLYTLDGTPLAADHLDAVAARLSDARAGRVVLRLHHGGSRVAWVFTMR